MDLICFRPSDGHYYEGHLQSEDLILIASDGLFDNLYEDFILQIIQNHLVNHFFVFYFLLFYFISLCLCLYKG